LAVPLGLFLFGAVSGDPTTCFIIFQASADYLTGTVSRLTAEQAEGRQRHGDRCVAGVTFPLRILTLNVILLGFPVRIH
jgi:hypothetical protein